MHDFLTRHLKRIEQQLDAAIPINHTPNRLYEAMRYSVLGGGKRIRALLVYATGTCCSLPADTLDTIAVAVELIHAYSLVHDDLPAMDNDDIRRGKPSCHIAFGEATAILVGDALQSLAFELLSKPSPYYSSQTQLTLIHQLSLAIGSQGMVGGQQLDIEYNQTPHKKNTNPDQLIQLNQLKTGALIRASVILPALTAQCPPTDLRTFGHFGDAVGLAFQVKDDILDHQHPDALSHQRASEHTTQLLTTAHTHLATLNQDAYKIGPLQHIAKYMIIRDV